MPRGVGRDKRETFSYDTVRLKNKNKGPHAPQKGTLELYFKEKILYKMEDNGVETPIGGFGASASPGFTWGLEGLAEIGDFLKNDTVPSSRTGRLIDFTQATLRKITVNRTNTAACRVRIIAHDGGADITLGTPNFDGVALVDLGSLLEKVQNTSIPIESGKQIAVYVESGQADNLVVGLLFDGLL